MSIFQVERLFLRFRHYKQSERWWVPAISSNGYTTDHWRWGDPGTYETVLGGEPGWETRLSRDKENHAQSSRQQRHVSDQLCCILIRQIFCISQLSEFRQTKQNIYDHADAFILFSHVHTNAFWSENPYFFDAVSPIIHTKTTENADGSDSIWRSVITIFKSLYEKPFIKAPVFMSVFGRFSVDDGRKRRTNYPFPNEET